MSCELRKMSCIEKNRIIKERHDCEVALFVAFFPEKNIINVTFSILKVTSDTGDFARYRGVEKDSFSERNSCNRKTAIKTEDVLTRIYAL